MALSRAKSLPALLALGLLLGIPPVFLCAQDRGALPGKNRNENPREMLRRSLEEMEARIEALKAETIPLLDELRELPSGYWGNEADRRFERREGLRARIQEKITKVKRVKREHDELMKRHEILALGEVLGSLGPTLKGVSKPLESGLVSYGRYRDYSRGLGNYFDRAGGALAAEGESFRAAQKSRKARRLWTIVGLLAVLALASTYLIVRYADLPAKVVVEGGGSVRILGGAFRLEEELFVDRLGVVNAATNIREKYPCAVWIMKNEAGLSVNEVAARAREAGRVRHPGLEAIRDVLLEEGRVCLILDPKGGEGLDRVLADAGRLAMGQGVDIMEEAARAFDHIHASGMAHGGLRLGDIRLQPEGRVKVGGFGMPRAEDPAYCAPEQMFAAARPASDLFALAVCAYRVVIGLFPFPGPDFPEQKRKMGFVPPSQALAGLPKGVDDIFRRALHPDPARRQSSCGEFAMALKSAWVRSRKRA